MVADRRVARADLARTHHFALVSHVLLTHVHLVICLVLLFLLAVAHLARLLEDLDPVLHTGFIRDLVASLIGWLWLLLARFLFVERLVVLRRLGAFVSARINHRYLLELLALRIIVKAILLSEALSAADPVIEVSTLCGLLLLRFVGVMLLWLISPVR